MLHSGTVRPDERGLITNPLGLAAVRLTPAISRGGRQARVAHHLSPGGARRRLRGVVSAHLEADHRPSACGPVRMTTELPLTPRASTKIVRGTLCPPTLALPSTKPAIFICSVPR